MSRDEMKNKAEEVMNEALEKIDIQDFTDFARICFDYASNRFEMGNKVVIDAIEKAKDAPEWEAETEINKMYKLLITCLAGKLATLAAAGMGTIAQYGSIDGMKGMMELHKFSNKLDLCKQLLIDQTLKDLE